MNVSFYQQDGSDIVGFHEGENGVCLLMRPSSGYGDEDKLQGMDKLCISTEDGAVYEGLASWTIDGDSLQIELGPKAQELGIPHYVDGKLPHLDSTEYQAVIDFLPKT